MSQSDEQRIKQFLVFAFTVLKAHQTEVQRTRNQLEAVTEYLNHHGQNFPEVYQQALSRIELRERAHPSPGTQSTAESIASMLQAIPSL